VFYRDLLTRAQILFICLIQTKKTKEREDIIKALTEDICRLYVIDASVADTQNVLIEGALKLFLNPDSYDSVDISHIILKDIQGKAQQARKLLTERLPENISRAKEIVQDISRTYFAHLRKPAHDTTIIQRLRKITGYLSGKRKITVQADKALAQLIEQIDDILEARQRPAERLLVHVESLEKSQRVFVLKPRAPNRAERESAQSP